MTTKADIVAEARSWLGTRYQHQASLKGVGCDCLGMVEGVGIALKLRPPEGFQHPSMEQFRGYGRDPMDGLLKKGCEMFGVPKSLVDAELGDVVLFHFGKDPRHVGILGDYPHGGLSIIHAYAEARKVVESRFDDVWASRVSAVYSFKGVTV